MIDGDDQHYCSTMLPKVSRTFAACIRLLPQKVEKAVLIAYLLCRIADTIEDTADLIVADKERLLAHFRTCLDEGGPHADPLAQAFASERTNDEQLTARADITLREFRRLDPAQRQAIRPWVQEMCDGMAEFARIHARARPDHLEALASGGGAGFFSDGAKDGSGGSEFQLGEIWGQ